MLFIILHVVVVVMAQQILAYLAGSVALFDTEYIYPVRVCAAARVVFDRIGLCMYVYVCVYDLHKKISKKKSS